MRGLLIAFCIALAALVCVPQQVDAGWRGGRFQNQGFGGNHQNGLQFNVGGFGFNIQSQNHGFGFQQQGHRPQFQQSNRSFQTQAFVDPFGRVFVRNRNGVLVRVR